MKEAKLTSKLRSKVTGVEGAKAYNINRAEALRFIKEFFIDPCTSVEQLDSLKLVPVFPLFKTPTSELNGWVCKHYVLSNSLFNHYMIHIYDDKNVYSCGLFWLSSGPFKRKIKKMVNDKKTELINFSNKPSVIINPAEEKHIENASKCPNCGAEIASDAKFCMKCGSVIPEKVSNCCPNCGNEISEEDAFCLKCGTKLK